MTTSLVTGGAGFVGRHLVRSLLERGDTVYCVDSLVPLTGALSPYSSKHETFKQGWPMFDPTDFERFHFIELDCRDWFQQNPEFQVDYAFHLAAVVGGRMMIEHHPLAVADDLSIDSAFWQWAKNAQPKKSICFSSSAAYPISLQQQDNFKLLLEDDIDFNSSIGIPDMTYGWAKLTSEYLAKLAYEKHGIKSVCFRPFSGYGPDQDLAYPFPSICKRVLENVGQNEIAVWGSGHQMRDFIHIRDCVEGILTITDQIDDASAVNLSTGIFTSFITLASMAANVLGYHPKIYGMSDKPEGVFARGGSTVRQNKLGFVAKTSLLDGVQECIEWFKKSMDNQ